MQINEMMNMQAEQMMMMNDPNQEMDMELAQLQDEINEEDMAKLNVPQKKEVPVESVKAAPKKTAVLDDLL